jgi:hypothetical protein
LQSLVNPEKFNSDLPTSTNDAYDNAEERRVIDQIETPAARRMGEPIRKDHRGASIGVSDPTYSENNYFRQDGLH